MSSQYYKCSSLFVGPKPPRKKSVTKWSGVAKDERIVGGLPRRVYRVLTARIHSGDVMCLLRYAEAYRPIAHMLDDYGVVKGGMAPQYSGLLRAAKNLIDGNTKGSLRYVLLRRLQDHLKKNKNRHRRDVAEDEGSGGDINARCLRRFGFTLDEYMAHVESKFQPGMTWDRVMAGDVQIDHEIPVRIFDLSTDSGIKAAYALSNTTPLWRGDNARKGMTKDKDWYELFGEGCIRG